MEREEKIKAVKNKDKRYDGQFFVAVKSTKIVCCPSCSSRTPLEKNIVFFDTLEEAVKAGNETLKVLSEHFQVRSDDRFKVRGLFGTPDRLVTNCCYTTKGIAYFAKITPLKFDDLSETIAETFKAYDRYRQYRREQENDE